MLILLLAPLAFTGPTKLVVVSHGLYGECINLQVLEEEIAHLGGSNVLVHLAACNEGKTRDGVAAGGKRLAHEVRKLVHEHKSLQSLVLVGNSLGGLYVRYAASELLNEDGACNSGHVRAICMTSSMSARGCRLNGRSTA